MNQRILVTSHLLYYFDFRRSFFLRFRNLCLFILALRFFNVLLNQRPKLSHIPRCDCCTKDETNTVVGVVLVSIGVVSLCFVVGRVFGFWFVNDGNSERKSVCFTWGGAFHVLRRLAMENAFIIRGSGAESDMNDDCAVLGKQFGMRFKKRSIEWMSL